VIGIIELLDVEHEFPEQVSQWQFLVFPIPQSLLLAQPVGQLPPVIIVPLGLEIVHVFEVEQVL